MTRLLTSGAETADPRQEPVVLAGNARIVTDDQAHSGYCSFRIIDIGASGGGADISNGTYVGARWTNVPGRWYYSRCWMVIVAPEVSNEIIMSVYHDAVPVQNFVLVSDGTLHRDLATGPLLATGINYYQSFCFEIGVRCDGVTQRHIILRLNGVIIDDIITTNALNYLGNEVRFGIMNPDDLRAIGRKFYMDDIAVNDDTGSENNSWPGINGMIAISASKADVAVGPNWMGGNGAVPYPAGYWQRVFGMPSGGVDPTHPDANMRMMRDSVPFSVDNADIQFESYKQRARYSQQGQPYNIKVTAVQLLCAAAREGTASLQAKLLSSPVSSTITINPASEPPGYYPVGWSVGRSADINGASIDPTIEPVVRLNKLAGSSGTIYCSEAAIQFEYEYTDGSSNIKNRFLCVV